jgi:L-2-hydroxyglutarate oxidase LhgO
MVSIMTINVVHKIEAAVIGSGVVGLATAAALAHAGYEVVILEESEAIGTGISSRNSEVIHSGIYYKKDSLKARLCVAGRRELYKFCAENNVPHEQCGKIIVATENSQISNLYYLKKRAEINGVTDLRLLTGKEAMEIEPELHCVGGLLSPSTGIVDSHSLMLSLLGNAENRGAILALNTPVIGGTIDETGIFLDVGGRDPCTIQAGIVVNSSGLHASKLMRGFKNFDAINVPKYYFAKGNYFLLSGRSPFRHLIYPVPEPGGLGIHLTLDLGYQARFGPDVEWVENIDYTVDPRRGDRFYDAIRKYWPGLENNSLRPGYAGIRPKLVSIGSEDADFVIQGPKDHGVPGLVNLYGIESPGLTASLAIGGEVLQRIRG